MKLVPLLVALTVALLAVPLAARQWTSRNGGFNVEAELLDVKDGKAVLKKADGSQISVPLSRLSLGDVRYINEALKAAEAGLVGNNPEPAPAAAKPAAESASATKLSPVTAATLKKLHYGWKKGQSYVYRVRIIGERGSDTENRSGDVTYTVKSTQLGEIQLAMKGDLKYSDEFHSRRFILLPGRHVMFATNVDKPREASIRIDPNGRLLESKGDSPLPYLLGDLAELIVERFPAIEEASWTITGDPGLAVVTLHYPYWRFSRAAFREGVPADEKTVYTVLGEADNLITIAKHYEMTSAATLAGKPRVEASGDGRLRFDPQRGVFASLDYDIKVSVRDANKTEDTPLHISYRLLSDQDIAEAARDAQKAKSEAEAARREKERPLNDQEIAAALVDLASDDGQRVIAAAKLLAEKKPAQPNPKAAQGLESVMLKSENGGARAEAARALNNWATAESTPGLLKALRDDWAPVRANAIEALCKSAPKEAIRPVAQQLSNGMTRGAAAKFLKAAGTDAEEAVLAQFQSTDAWQRAEICRILEAIGTKKSLPALEKAVFDDNWMVNGPARKAVATIKSREGIGATK